MIDLRQVSKKFGRLLALDQINLKFEAGKSYAMIGPNGSGKTTIIKSILGMVIPSTGEIFVDNENIKNHWSYRNKIGYMPQIGRYPENMRIGQLFDMMKNIRIGKNEFDEELVHEFSLSKYLKGCMRVCGTRQKGALR